ncbi:F-box/LRR-repeat protein At2g42730 [Salvia hispanica]|uniref:F-box/LRR-repeat protein At2g42730 n=1 Tax=Salvia hispanica TaxID=49212 RepID=UPI002009596E|nr:F-box/LRR-repeat protein At2g42730 [Salvia hispanica]
MAKKQRSRLEDDYTGDRISKLPDEILGLILSSMSLKEAIKTSALSSRWRSLWIVTRKLDIDLDSTTILDNRRNSYNINKLRFKFVRWIDRLFTTILPESSSTTLNRFRVVFDLSSLFSGWIDDWLSSAVSRKVESLELILNTYSNSRAERCYCFPYEKGNFPDNLKLLKKLNLHYVNVSGAAVAFLLGNCRLLEHLSLSRCGNGLSSLEVVGTSPVFKCLEISQCTSLKSIVVRESNVVCIKYAGPSIPHSHFKLEGVHRLTQLWIKGRPEMMRYDIKNIRGIIDMFDSVLPQLHTLKIYTMSKITGNDTLEKIMPKLKELVVVLGREYLDNCSLVPIINWFGVAPCLERFILEASHQVPRALEANYLLNGSDYDVSKINRKIEVQLSYSHIKEVEFVGYRGVHNHLQMITQLVRHAVALEKIIVDPRSFELRPNMPWDRISRIQMEDEIIARQHAEDQLKHVASRINVYIL